jgi:hypothetical protein
VKIDTAMSNGQLLSERDRATRNRRDPYARARIAKIDRILAARGYLVG